MVKEHLEHKIVAFAGPSESAVKEVFSKSANFLTQIDELHTYFNTFIAVNLHPLYIALIFIFLGRKKGYRIDPKFGKCGNLK